MADTFYNPKNPDQKAPAVEPGVVEFSQTGLPPEPEPVPLPIVSTPEGAMLKEGDFQSPNFVTRKSGWRIRSDGSAEFRSLTANFTQLLKSYTAGEALTQGDAVVPLSYPANEVAYDNSVFKNGSGATVTQALTVGSNSNRLLIVAVGILDNNTSYSTSGVTYNGVAMTNLATVGTGVGGECTLWYLVAPSTGANNIVVSKTTAASVDIYAYSFYNAVQTAPANYSATSTTAAVTDSAFTPTLNGSMVLHIFTGGGVTGASDTPANNQLNSARSGHTSALYPISQVTPAPDATYSSANIIADFWVAIRPNQTSATQRVYKTDADFLGLTTGFLGFAAQNIASGEEGDVVIAGIADGLSNISIGTQYYISNTSGGLSSSAGTNTRKAAVGVSSTEVLVTNIW